MRTVSRKDVFEPRTSTGSMVVFLSLCLYLNKFVLLSVLTHKEKICLRIRAKPLRENAKSLIPVDVRRSKMVSVQFVVIHLGAFFTIELKTDVCWNYWITQSRFLADQLK